MIKIVLTNDIVKRISAIDENRFKMNTIHIPHRIADHLRKISKKKSSYASNKIEGNPLSEQQADEVVEQDPHRHFLKPEQEVRNYYMALQVLEEKAKIGLRGEMPPGFLFAVYDSESGEAEYIPPEYCDIPELLDELVEYVNTTDDHPLIVAAIVHYQLVTIHPFEDGNGRTARLMSGYVLTQRGYGFHGIGSLEEYFAYDADEYYQSLQMGLPALYYSGRENPPHPEIWFDYFLRMVELYSTKVCEISEENETQSLYTSLSHLRPREKEFLAFLLQNHIYEFTPIDVSKMLGITNRTVINRCTKLAENGFAVPVIVKERIRSYKLSDYSKLNEQEIQNKIIGGHQNDRNGTK